MCFGSIRYLREFGVFLGAILTLTFGFFCAAHAYVVPITHIEKMVSNDHLESSTNQQSLPFFVRQERAGLTQISWSFRIPATLAQEQLPALLMPQPVQGAVLTVGQEVIYELPGSDSKTLRNWYLPVLISVPRSMLKLGEDTEIRVTQSAHLRGWFIAPLFVGDLQDLRKIFTHITFISQTLYTTINVLSGLVGFFFLVIGLRVRSYSYIYGGMSTLTWSALISLALTNELPTDSYFIWRMALYAATGMLIYFVSLFTITVFQHRLPPSVRLAGLTYLQSGWLLYALIGPESERALDVIWTGFAVCIYVMSAGWVIVKAVNQRQFARVIPIALHWLLTSLLAVHDYIVQSGLLPFNLPETTQPLWVYLVMQPIYMTHIALPLFVIMAMWLLIQDHSQKVSNELRYVNALSEQRERIVNDIHDGVGSRLNLLLWSLRTSAPSTDQIESDLQRCMEELRFAINPSQSGHETLHQALLDLTKRLKIQAHAHGIELDYQRTGEASSGSSEIGLHLYKATQECLSNALRHSQATNIQVSLHQKMTEWKIEVRDDGTGIPDWNEASQSSPTVRSTSLGLKSLYQRIESKGGQVHIASSREGTLVKMSVRW